MPSLSRFACLAMVAALMAGCGATQSPSPSLGPSASVAAPTASATTGPESTDEPGTGPGPGSPAGASSQALIAADLESGAIDAVTSLRYRAWALFGGPDLPERYDGAGSVGEDPRLFDDIVAALPSMSEADRSDLGGWLRRPTDPESNFAAAGNQGRRVAAAVNPAPAPPMAAAAPAPTPTPRCSDTRLDWFSRDWNPAGNPDIGFRVWACADTQADADTDIQPVIDVGAKLWAPMTAAVPAGMGRPVSDAGTRQSNGSGHTDVYLVDPLAPCRQRGNSCAEIPTSALAVAASDFPQNCAVSGFPARGCTGYMILGRSSVLDARFAYVFAHEFFHVLQKAHNDILDIAWYHEASANWAGWQFVVTSNAFTSAQRRAGFLELNTRFRQFQADEGSLLRWTPAGAVPQYAAWVWPLFQAIVDGPGNVYLSWQAMESAATDDAYEKAIDRQLPFEDNFRDFAAWNAQPAAYRPPELVGLDAIRWQLKPTLSDLAQDPHRLDGAVQELELGTTFVGAVIDSLDAQYQVFTVASDVRQLTIDISDLQGVGWADLDVIAQLTPQEDALGFEWSRFRPAGPKLILCADKPEEDVQFLEVIVSNHASVRVKAGSSDIPNPFDRVEGSFKITAEDACDVPDGFTGSIGGSNSRADSWSGSATFERIRPGDPDDECTPGTYCYRLVSGQVAWTCRSGATVSVTVGPPDKPGSLVLYVKDPNFPQKDNTYGAIIVATNDDECPTDTGPQPSKPTVVAWLAIGDVPVPKIGPGWQLSGVNHLEGCGIEGDCGFQTWTWDLSPVFDP